jgi:shikimate kinase
VSHVLLYGPPGAGKSTVGKELAAFLELPFVDLDLDVERAAGRSIPDLMAEGEDAFRDVEAAVLRRILARSPFSTMTMGFVRCWANALRTCRRCSSSDASTTTRSPCACT